jgi:hypothetical protein
VSACIVTIASEDRLERIAQNLRPLVDEIVVVVDSRSVDGTTDIARRVADRVEFVKNENFLSIYFPMFEYCSGSWILRIDDDETLCDMWSRERMDQLINAPNTTNYYLARKWIVTPNDRYICETPLFPNFALRLFRNDRSIAGVPATVHSQLPIAGPSGYPGDLHILHWNLVMYDRASREEKIHRYRRSSPEAAAGAGEEYYLYEDYSYDTMPLSEPRPISWDRDESSDWPYYVDTRIANLPPLRAGRPCYIAVDVRNRSNRPLQAKAAAHPHPDPNLSYGVHWFGADAGTHTIVRGAEGPFTPIWEPIAINQAGRAIVQVSVPEVVGRYWIRADIFESGVGWFSQLRGSGDLSFKPVEVVPDHARPAQPR